LVDELREAGDAVFSVVAVKDERVVGHAMFSKMKAPFAAAALGPVAVMPELQRNGIGSQLIRYGLAQSEAAGGVGIFVLENPAYYRRFGFRADTASCFESAYAGPHLMALTLGRGDRPARSGSIQYAPAFASLGYTSSSGCPRPRRSCASIAKAGRSA